MACFSGSRNGSPRSERFDDSDKFRPLLGKSRRETFTHLLNLHSCIDMAGSLYGALGQIRLKIKLHPLPSLEVLPVHFSSYVGHVGHGGAQQYTRGSRIRSLRQCVATMLWGCNARYGRV